MILTLLYSICGSILAKQIAKKLTRPKSTPRCFPPPPYKNILKSAVMSRLAYEDPKTFKERLSIVCPPRCDIQLRECLFESEIKFYDSFEKTKGVEDTQAYMLIHDRTCYLIFRGTEDMIDAMADLDARYIVFENQQNVKVHRGFYEQFKAVQKEINDELFSRESEYDNIVITGHSLGAALATIAALHFSIVFPNKNVSCHTFGSPRVGNSEFVKQFQKYVTDHWRVFNVADPVPMVPMSFRFTHVGSNSLAINSKDSSHDIYQSDSNWFIRPIISLIHIDMLAPILHHDCVLYINQLDEICDSTGAK